MNLNNNLQQKSQFKQIIRPSPVSWTVGHDPKRLGWSSDPRHVFCHIFYQEKHYAPDCNLKFRENLTTVFNHEKLNSDENVRLPITSYNQTQELVTADNEPRITADINQTE